MSYKAVVTRRSNDELQHFKYIKREKKNGKWKYYYDVKDAMGYDERSAMNLAKKSRDVQKNYTDLVRREYEETASKVASGEYFDKDNGNDSIVKPYRDKYTKALESQYDKSAEYAKALQAYQKTPLGKLEKAAMQIDKGKQKVEDLMKKMTKKLGIH